MHESLKEEGTKGRNHHVRMIQKKSKMPTNGSLEGRKAT